MPQDNIMPSLLNEAGEFPRYFQQDGAPPHYGICIRRWLDQQFPRSWIGPVEWPARSPDLNPLDFYLWGHLKAMVYKEKIQDMDHLKERIWSGITYITPDVLTRVHHEWERRRRVCLQRNGIHVENVL